MFFTDDDKVARTIFKDVEASRGRRGAAKVMGGFKEHMAGPPTKLFGDIFWTLKGDAKPATRVTIVPLKPGRRRR